SRHAFSPAARYRTETVPFKLASPAIFHSTARLRIVGWGAVTSPATVGLSSAAAVLPSINTTHVRVARRCMIRFLVVRPPQNWWAHDRGPEPVPTRASRSDVFPWEPWPTSKFRAIGQPASVGKVATLIVPRARQSDADTTSMSRPG